MNEHGQRMTLHDFWKQAHCQRCGRQAPSERLGDWIFVMRGGAVAGAVCPRCQVRDEHTEAKTREAQTDFTIDAFGRVLWTTHGA